MRKHREAFRRRGGTGRAPASAEHRGRRANKRCDWQHRTKESKRRLSEPNSHAYTRTHMKAVTAQNHNDRPHRQATSTSRQYRQQRARRHNCTADAQETRWEKASRRRGLKTTANSNKKAGEGDRKRGGKQSTANRPLQEKCATAAQARRRDGTHTHPLQSSTRTASFPGRGATEMKPAVRPTWLSRSVRFAVKKREAVEAHRRAGQAPEHGWGPTWTAAGQYPCRRRRLYTGSGRGRCCPVQHTSQSRCESPPAGLPCC